MRYQSLYRKWRPDRFSEVKGQDHIVTSLKNQVTHNMIGHAYLFCGTRGTGKTSIAKLFAKTVNCESPVDGAPCCKCASCMEIQSNTSMDVIEIDAASNNGVDNIRKINEELAYAPQTGKYKIYIIDEVHMLSPGAFNALLKSLEEPPAYVIFILATTEAQKIPVTISSRCQKYMFKRISIEVISNRLMEILEREGIAADKAAVDYIAKAADGSMRDGLSILERIIMTNLGKRLTYEEVIDCLGIVQIDIFLNMFLAITCKDAEKALNILNEAFYAGAELNTFISDMIWFLRTTLILKASNNARVDVTDEMVATIREAAKMVSVSEIIRCINEFSELLYRQKMYDNKKMFLEISILKLILWNQENGLSEERGSRETIITNNDKITGISVEDNITENSVADADKEHEDEQRNVSKALPTNETFSAEKYPQASREELNIIRNKWYDFVNMLPADMKEVVCNAGLYPTADNIALVIDPDDKKSMDFYSNNMESFKRYMYAITGRTFNICVGVI